MTQETKTIQPQEETHRKRGDGYSQVKELIEHRVQRLQLHLCALTFGHWEKVVRTELHYDKRVTQTLGGAGKESETLIFESQMWISA